MADDPGDHADQVASLDALIADIQGRKQTVLDRIASVGGDPAAVTLVAVTKGFGDRTAICAARAGLLDLGENYAQEMDKAINVHHATGLDVRWHFIGRLQRNKVKAIAGLVDLWQTVDRPELGAEIARRAPGARVLVQVNVSDEPQKGGCPPDEVPALVGVLGEEHGLDVAGLMTVGRTGAPADARAGFRVLRRLADDLDLPIRSMGMSGDLEVAVEEGSTMVRVGNALFGPRPAR